MDTNIDEQWVEIPKVKRFKKGIVSISNTGMYRRADGSTGCLDLRHKFYYNGKLKLCYRVIAEQFLITVKRPDQNQIDHITHHPNEYNVNDVRNLRWCTNAENHCFEEARTNQSKENCCFWKGGAVGPNGAYRRALKEYRANPTQENLAALEEARLIRNGYQRLRAKKSRQ